MDGVLDEIGKGFSQAFEMAYQVWWALVLGFAISAIVQAWVPRRRIEGVLAGAGVRPVALATGLGAASSSCSYAAIAIARSLFEKGASATAAFAFELASTNLVWELGLVLWVLLGWQFTLAEYVGGVVMIVLLALAIRLLVSPSLEAAAREHARAAAAGGHVHHSASIDEPTSVWQRLGSAEAWSDVAHNFAGDWQMLWKEITIGLLLSGFIGLLPDSFFSGLFVRHGSHLLRGLENVVLGPIVAVLSFVCSVGNVPLAAVLWSGGISFAAVIAFIFADLIVLPIVVAYRKYYGDAFALRITALLFLTMVGAALVVSGLFDVAGLIPTGRRPRRSEIFVGVHADYKLVLDLIALAVFAALFAITRRRGATDPICGMRVDRSKAISKQVGGETFYFCSHHCLHAFEAQGSRVDD